MQLKNLKFPNSLKELSLRGCLLPWSYLAIVGSLPHLQILHLLKRAVVGAAWNLGVEEKFFSLKYLQIKKCDDLTHWDADNFNFPVLETLYLEHLSKLEEIPSGMGEIPTLEIMDICDCGESATMSAIKILEEQQSLENLDLQLLLSFQGSEAKMWKRKIRELGITCQNLHISTH